MTMVTHPAVQRFIERLPATLPVAQVVVTRLDRGFELRHVEDSNKPAECLRVLGISDLRALARVNAALSDAEAGAVIRACCAARFCLKRRWWTVKGLPPDDASAKSIIPCLEPCALLLDLARLAATESPAAAPPLSEDEIRKLTAVADTPASPVATAADLSHPDNPRRTRWLAQRHALALAKPLRQA